MARPGRITDAQAASALADIAEALIRECKRLDAVFDDCSANVQPDLEAVLGCDFEEARARRLLKFAQDLGAGQ